MLTWKCILCLQLNKITLRALMGTEIWQFKSWKTWTAFSISCFQCLTHTYWTPALIPKLLWSEMLANTGQLLLLQVWNNVGIVRQYSSEDENSIDVEFHDTSVHHTLHLNNTAGHTMATLSTEALVLACEAQDDQPRLGGISRFPFVHLGRPYFSSVKKFKVMPLPDFITKWMCSSYFLL